MIESQKCPGLEKDVEAQICSLEEQWAALNTHSSEKTQKLTEATQEQHFNEATKGMAAKQTRNATYSGTFE